MPRIIEVVPHSPTWQAAFAEEARVLEAVFALRLRAIHHIGSTAVPGLAAKPVIDILIVLDETHAIETFSPAMERLGYRIRGECLDAPVPGTPGRFYFSKDTDGARSHHVHVCAEGHPQIGDLLGLRDYLRAHPSRAADYGQVKQRLAIAHRHDSIDYMRGKDAKVKELVQEARAWHEPVDWGREAPK